jgi:hypothetical protein
MPVTYQEKDLNKLSKEELIAGMRELMNRLVDNHTNSQAVRERAARAEFSSDIEFIFDVDVLEARGINISETGIAFSVEQGLPVELKFKHQGKDHHYRARLVRTQSLKQGGFMLALEFAGEVQLGELPPAPGEDDPMVIL